MKEFLLEVKIVYGDMSFMEFSDEFLKEHVNCISIVDTDHIPRAAQVGQYFNYDQVVSSHIYTQL